MTAPATIETPAPVAVPPDEDHLIHICATHALAHEHPCVATSECRSFCGQNLEGAEHIATSGKTPDDCVVCEQMFAAWFDRVWPC